MKITYPLEKAKTPAATICISILVLLTGCLPIPHATERSEEVKGRVLDADTHLPIKGAMVYLAESPHHTTYTDAAGNFRLKASRNFHLIYVAPGGSWPNDKTAFAQVSYPKYQLYEFNAYVGGNVGDLMLKPERR